MRGLCLFFAGMSVGTDNVALVMFWLVLALLL